MPAVCCPVFRLTDSLNRPQGVPLPFSLTGPRLERKVYIRTRTGPPSPTPSQTLPPPSQANTNTVVMSETQSGGDKVKDARTRYIFAVYGHIHTDPPRPSQKRRDERALNLNVREFT